MDRKTPLYERHVSLGGQIVPFGGYLLPVRYEGGVIFEHMAVRERAGLFDVSHMGEFSLEGDKALGALEGLLCNSMTGMEIGQARYSPMLNEQGGIVDDLVVYRLAEESYMIVVNASNREKDFAWMSARVAGADFCDISDGIAQLALQGPKSGAILKKLADASMLPGKYYHFTRHVDVGGVDCLVARTGYTGERGFELYAPAADAVKLWDMLLEAGAEYGIAPCGLGARDTLRLEAAMPLYGHELADDISPLEAGLAWAFKAEGREFIGREACLSKGAPRERVGLKITGKGIAREHQDIYVGDKKVGQTTSGTHCPFLGGAYALALIDAGVEGPLEVDVRGRRVAAERVPLPFYKRAK